MSTIICTTGTKGTATNRTFAKRQQAESHECSFWKAWVHIAKWCEEDVDALKETKVKEFHRRRERLQMKSKISQWVCGEENSHWCHMVPTLPNVARRPNPVEGPHNWEEPQEAHPP